MSGASHKSGFTPRSAMPAFGAFGSQQPSASLLFEKSNPGLRRSTPDSEALASSDDEPDHIRTSAANSVKLPKPTRRTSWLNDVSAATLTRKTSGNIQYSPSTSNPGTPGADQSGWPQSISAVNASAWNAAAASSPWNGIWSQDARREPPPRLQEVMHNAQGIPFSIPLQPTPKTYRSQSYSVGQLDTTSGPPSMGSTSTSNDATRARVGGQYPSLQRRASRPSGLGVLEEGGLGRLREVDDDEEQEQYFGESNDRNNTQASRIAKLEFENAQLRHAAQARDRTVSATTASSQPPNSAFRSLRSQGSMPESYDTAVDDHESMSGSGLLQRGTATRRMSEQAASTYERQYLGQPEGQGYDSSRKAHWQTSLGFGAIPEAPQSRRHSLADVPSRHGSFSSHGRMPIRTLQLPLETDTAGKDERQQHMYDSLAQDMSHGDDPRYFNTNEDTRRLAEEHVQQSFMAGVPYSPHAHLGTYVGPSSQPLHIVNFKCCRSDVFYVQEGTGLHVNTGDLVIVEADRGTDLGTVQHTNVTWDEARRYKDHYAEEHYKWLMMFSQQSKNGGPNVINPNGLPTKPGSAVGGMGPPGHQNPHEPVHGDLKPKMIKRLAQNHEIQSLKDKEGNEAKAKRVCQQKVADHRLTMEILDAEFQMDSKKLTFFYFADSYINFNSLVTDLFKIYKTRIWMSAINPASFQTPTSSLGLQPALGGVGAGRDSPANRRRQYNQQPASASFNEYDNDRAFAEQGSLRNAYMGQYPAYPPGFSQGHGINAFGNGNMQDPMDPFGQYYAQPYPMLNPNAPNFASGRTDLRSRSSNQPAAGDWNARFQGLSLGS